MCVAKATARPTRPREASAARASPPGARLGRAKKAHTNSFLSLTTKHDFNPINALVASSAYVRAVLAYLNQKINLKAHFRPFRPLEGI